MTVLLGDKITIVEILESESNRDSREDKSNRVDVKDYLKNVMNSDAIYNLQGVRVSAPVKGQVYVKGGKKFIQK